MFKICDNNYFFIIYFMPLILSCAKYDSVDDKEKVIYEGSYNWIPVTDLLRQQLLTLSAMLVFL